MCWSRESVEIEVAVEVDLGVINRVAYHIGRGACASPGKEMDSHCWSINTSLLIDYIARLLREMRVFCTDIGGLNRVGCEFFL